MTLQICRELFSSERKKEEKKKSQWNVLSFGLFWESRIPPQSICRGIQGNLSYKVRLFYLHIYEGGLLLLLVMYVVISCKMKDVLVNTELQPHIV